MADPNPNTTANEFASEEKICDETDASRMTPRLDDSSGMSTHGRIKSSEKQGGETTTSRHREASKMEYEVLPDVPELACRKTENLSEELKSKAENTGDSVKGTAVEECVRSDGSSEDKSWNVGKGVGALVQKFRNLGSPKKPETSPDKYVQDLELLEESLVTIPPHLRDKKCQTRRKMAMSSSDTDSCSKQSGSTITEDDTASPLFTADEIEMTKSPDVELVPSKMSLVIKGDEPPRKTSPLRNIIDKCKDLMASTKKVSDVASTFASAETQTEKRKIERTEELGTENPLAVLQVSLPSASDVDSKLGEKNLFKSVYDKTKDFIKGRISAPVTDPISHYTTVPRGPIQALPPDTPCSGEFADVSETSAISGSSSSTSEALICIEDTKRKKLVYCGTVEDLNAMKLEGYDTVIESPERDVQVRQPQAVNPEVKEEDAEESCTENPKSKALEHSETVIEFSKFNLPKHSSAVKNLQVQKLKADEFDKMDEEHVELETSPKRDVAQSPRKRTPPIQRQKRIELISPDDLNKDPVSLADCAPEICEMEQDSEQLQVLQSLPVGVDGHLQSPAGMNLAPGGDMSESFSTSNVCDGKRRGDGNEGACESPTKRANKSSN